MEKPAGSIEAGRYDKELHDAIMQFQREVGAKPDGVVGPATVTAAQTKAKTKPFYEPWNSLRGSRRRKRKPSSRLPGGIEMRQIQRDPEKDRQQMSYLRLQETNEGSGCGSPGKRDVKKKVVLDEKSQLGARMVNGKCESCSRGDDCDLKSKCVGGKKVKKPLEEELQQERQQRKADKNPNSPGNQKLAQQQRDRGMTVKSANEGQDQNEDGKKDSEKKNSKKKSGKKKMVKGPDGTLVPHYAVDGKGSKDLTKVAEGSKIHTPEQEQALYESRFNNRNEQIFDKLKKLWTK